jgi:hypothetical protein
MVRNPHIGVAPYAAFELAFEEALK